LGENKAQGVDEIKKKIDRKKKAEKKKTSINIYKKSHIWAKMCPTALNWCWKKKKKGHRKKRGDVGVGGRRTGAREIG